MAKGSSQSGSILVITLWVLALFSFISITLANQALLEIQTLSTLKEHAQALNIAWSAVERAKEVLVSDKDSKVDSFRDPWAINEKSFSRITLAPEAGDFASVETERLTPEAKLILWHGIRDEDSLMNLNTVASLNQGTALSILMRLPMMTEEAAESLLDWVDQDSEAREKGAEKSYYETLRAPHDIRNGPLEALEELFYVRGMTPDIYRAIEPYLTVYGSGKVNLNTVPAPVLVALGLSEKTAEVIVDYRSGPDNKDGTEDDHLFLDISDARTQLQNGVLTNEQFAEFSQLTSMSLIGVSSETFRISVVVNNVDLKPVLWVDEWVRRQPTDGTIAVMRKQSR